MSDNAKTETAQCLDCEVESKEIDVTETKRPNGEFMKLFECPECALLWKE